MAKIRLKKLLPLWLPLLLVVASGSAQGNPTATADNTVDTPMVVRYYDRGLKDARHAYKFELIKQILDATRKEFGDYTIVPFGEEPSAKRQALLISEGQILNLLWASPGTVIARADVHTIPVDILRGLLGYRVCLMNPENFPADPRQLTSLHQLSIGQGLNWQDIEIYKHNEIPLKQAPTFEALFDMLAAKRFQCLPLGADEVMYTFRDKKAQYPFLAVDSELLIYYNYPIYLHVSKKFPLLAERVELGLKKLQDSGEFMRLFNKHHATDLAQLNLRQRKIFCLPSPYLPDKHICEKALNYPDGK